MSKRQVLNAMFRPARLKSVAPVPAVAVRTARLGFRHKSQQDASPTKTAETDFKDTARARLTAQFVAYNRKVPETEPNGDGLGGDPSPFYHSVAQCQHCRTHFSLLFHFISTSRSICSQNPKLRAVPWFRFHFSCVFVVFFFCFLV